MLLNVTSELRRSTSFEAPTFPQCAATGTAAAEPEVTAPQRSAAVDYYGISAVELGMAFDGESSAHGSSAPSGANYTHPSQAGS